MAKWALALGVVVLACLGFAGAFAIGRAADDAGTTTAEQPVVLIQKVDVAAVKVGRYEGAGPIPALARPRTTITLPTHAVTTTTTPTYVPPTTAPTTSTTTTTTTTSTTQPTTTVVG